MSVSNSNDKQFIIPFIHMKLGTHEFEFEITDAFFEESEYSIVKKGKVKVTLSFEKKETMMIGNFSINGTVITDCDRCTDPVEIETMGNYRLVYKFDTVPSDDESLMIVYPEDFNIDVRESILEFINVSMATRAVHEEGQCNEEMADLLNEYIVSSDFDSADPDDDDDFDDDDYDDDDDLEEETLDQVAENTNEEDEEPREIDPRWNALKNLKK